MYKIKTMAAVLLCAGLFAGCGEKDYNADVSNDLPHYVYSPTAAKETKVAVTDILIENKTEASFEFKVSYAVAEAKTATVTATVEPDLSLVADYNKKMSTNLLPFPVKYLSFPNTTVNIPSGSDVASVAFKLIDLDKLPKAKDYLLPITIKSVNASNGFPLHEKQKTAYYLISRLQKITLVDYSDAHREGGGPETVLDGNLTDATYWHSDYEVPALNGGHWPLPHWIVLDCGAPSAIKQIETYRRANGDTKTIEYYISDNISYDDKGKVIYNSANWKKIANHTFPEKYEWWTPWSFYHRVEHKFSPPEKGRYVQLRVTESYRNVFTAIMSVNIMFEEPEE